MTTDELTALANKIDAWGAGGTMTVGDYENAARVVRAIAKLEGIASRWEVEIISRRSPVNKWRIQKDLETYYAATIIEAIEGEE